MVNSETQLLELQSVLETSRQLLPELERSGLSIADSLKTGGKLLTCGNGGSATDAMHLAEELVGRYKEDRSALAAVCLNADPSTLTCIGNDYGYDAVFARQVQALARQGDVLVGFTTSGNSPNVLRAFECAKDLKITTVLVSGKDGGLAKGITDFELIVPSQSTARIQEVHTFILHQWLEIIEAELFGMNR